MKGQRRGKGWAWPQNTEEKDKTVEACRKMCHDNNAKFFTFRKGSKNCWCKSKKGRAGPKPNEDAVSGT